MKLLDSSLCGFEKSSVLFQIQFERCTVCLHEICKHSEFHKWRPDTCVNRFQTLSKASKGQLHRTPETFKQQDNVVSRLPCEPVI